ncbi:MULTISPECIES: ABC transporter permease [Curtobacterium]|jgi:ABC-2 type transport system permease protein|uniref:ABC transporter permease n=1 Tax=Curtobacterium poinsettiae TaxID=159612 RepID=A0ABT3S4J0_9MICO|nr:MULTISPECIES: ABC transporter permease [Curtobacterium]MBT1610910.1 ABC transporter permease [Curtobacterium flaccumfaciens pv. poinsettiae]MCU0151340.1 ABC transporter permease [Curtobacterium flaccumfaciens pv. poinsettiae]MCX2849181.1 ABC transporter permease [Curtobacterium flaccumfaciens pv. poinsettiae]MDQ0539528.1 ABC-2 type transport system permease protein [Curtobacterium flaccumfaciens]UXN16640.1 ABC transporter permease [Curtobacterium flaccumfaciens pv. poinsettiae]
MTTVTASGRMPIRYVYLETKRQLRNVRAMVFTFAVPVIMLLVFGSAFGSQTDPTTRLQYLVVTTLQMAAYGAMMAALSQAFAIVNERSIGWNRQLRVTPLSGWGFMVSKVIAAMAFAAVSIVITVVVATVGMHASLDPLRWFAAGFGIWCGVIPFALIAILIGQFAKPSFAQPLFMVVFMGMAILGGLWVPLSVMPEWMGTVAHLLPSYWLNRIGQMGAGATGATGSSGMVEPAMVLACWAIVLAAVIVWRYRRDAARQ